MAALSEDADEAIVIGSGFGGAVATCRLAQAGVDVALLERGRRYSHGTFPRHPVRYDLMDWQPRRAYDVRALQEVMIVIAASKSPRL